MEQSISRRLVVWTVGALWSLIFWLFAFNACIVGAFSGSDNHWCQFWCFVVAAIVAQLLPWLMSVRAEWSARIGAGLAACGACSLLAVVTEFFGCWYSAIFGNGYLVDFVVTCCLWLCIAVFVASGLFCCFRRKHRKATPRELFWLRLVGRVALVLGGGFAIFAMLIFGGLLVAIYSEVWWRLTLAYVSVVAAYALFIWPLAELLPRGTWRRVCFRLLLVGLMPGLLCSSVSYFIGLPISGFPGDDLLLIRIFYAQIPLAVAFFMWGYIRRRITESPQENVGKTGKSPQENVDEMPKSPQENVDGA